MRIRKTGPDLGSAISPTNVFQVPYDKALTAFDSQIAVPTALPAGIIYNGTLAALVSVRNVSAGGQIIRVGGQVEFAPAVMGITLYPGDGFTWENVAVALLCLANAAGALLDCDVLAI